MSGKITIIKIENNLVNLTQPINVLIMCDSAVNTPYKNNKENKEFKHQYLIKI